MRRLTLIAVYLEMFAEAYYLGYTKGYARASQDILGKREK